MTTDTGPAAQASGSLTMADLLALREKLLAERSESFKVEAQHYMDVMSMLLRMHGRALPQPEVVGDGADLALLAEWEDDNYSAVQVNDDGMWVSVPVAWLGIGADGKINATWDTKWYKLTRGGTYETE